MSGRSVAAARSSRLTRTCKALAADVAPGGHAPSTTLAVNVCQEDSPMTDYERTSTRETRSVGSRPDTYPPIAAPESTVRTTERAYTAAGPDGPSVAARVVTFAFGILQALLILRIILLLLVANPGNDIVALVFGITQPFVEPFAGMFSLDRVKADQGSVLDIAAIVALVGWTLIEALILAALRIFQRRPVQGA